MSVTMTDVLILDNVRLGFVIILMLVASYFDLRTREINDNLWYIAIAGGVVINIFQFITDFSMEFVIMLSSSLIIAGIIGFTIYYLGLFGGADAKAMISIGMILPVFQPQVGIHPFSTIIVFTNGLILSLLPAVFMIGYNLFRIAKGENLFSGFESERVWRKGLAMVVGYKTSSPGGHFLLSIERASGTKKAFDFSPSKAGDDFVETAGTWVTPGIPLLIFITAGLFLMLLYGDLSSIVTLKILGL